MDETRKAEARARFAGMETSVLERMWVREERVDWAEAALHDELLTRGVDFEGMADRVAGPAPVQPAWIRPLEAPVERPTATTAEPAGPLASNCLFVPVFLVLLAWTIALYWRVAEDHSMTLATRRIVLPLVFLAMGGFGMFRIWRKGFRQTFVATWAVGLLVGSMIWVARPTRPADAPSVMEGMGVVGAPVVTENETRLRAVLQMRASISAWSGQYAQMNKDSVIADGPSPWEAERVADTSGREAIAQEMLAWRSEIAARVGVDDTLVIELKRETAVLPADLREQFTRTVVIPAEAFVAAEKERLRLLRHQVLLVDNLSALAATQPPVWDLTNHTATFSGAAAGEYASIVAQRDVLSNAEHVAGVKSRAACDHFLQSATLTLGRLTI